MWVTGVQDGYTAEFTALLSSVNTDDGINYYDWATAVGDGNGGFTALDGGPSGSHSLGTAMTEMNNLLLTIPEAGLIVRAFLQGEDEGDVLFTCQAPPGTMSNGQTIAEALAYDLTTSMADVGVSIDLPAAGTYIIAINVTVTLSQSAGGGGNVIAIQLYDSTNAVVVPGAVFIPLQVFEVGGGLTISPGEWLEAKGYTVPYTITAPATIQLQASVATLTDVTDAEVFSTGATATSLVWFQIA